MFDDNIGKEQTTDKSTGLFIIQWIAAESQGNNTVSREEDAGVLVKGQIGHGD